jgi:hypothetical protein
LGLVFIEGRLEESFWYKPLWNFSSIGGIIRFTFSNTSLVAEDISGMAAWPVIASDKDVQKETCRDSATQLLNTRKRYKKSQEET